MNTIVMNVTEQDIRPNRFFRNKNNFTLKVTPRLHNKVHALINIQTAAIIQIGVPKYLAYWLSANEYEPLVLKDKTLRVGDAFKNSTQTLILDQYAGEYYLIDINEHKIVYRTILPSVIKTYLRKNGFL